jgi:uncharacterized protein (TIGR02145 family)
MPYVTYQGKMVQAGNKYASRVVQSIFFPTVIVGTQTWMLYNADANIPNSYVYDDNEANRPLYGGLYQYADLNTLVSYYPGFRIPTLTDYATMSTFLGGNSVAGTHLKEAGTAYWNSGGDNTSGWGARGGGIRTNGGGYVALKTDGYFLTTDPNNLVAVFSGFAQFYSSWSYASDQWFSVRFIKI